MFVPVNKLGVALLFAQSAPLLGFSLIGNERTCDALCLDHVTGLPVRVSFEIAARNLSGRVGACDLAVVWLNNWPACPVPVLALRDWAASASVIPRPRLDRYVASLPPGQARLIVRKNGGQLSVILP